MITFEELIKTGKPFAGVFIQSGSPEFLEASAYAGFRYVGIDLEHTYYGAERTVELVRAGEAAGVCVLVRVPCLDATWIKKALDLGAAGIIVPNIDNAEQAAQAVSLCRFYPEGTRGACPGVRANQYGAGGTEYYRKANRETAVIALIESPEGIKNAESIINTPGLSACFLGPVDLSVAMGLQGNLDAPEVKQALLDTIAVANAAGVPVGALGLDYAFIKELFRKGMNFVAYGIDTMLMYRTCKDIITNLDLE